MAAASSAAAAYPVAEDDSVVEASEVASSSGDDFEQPRARGDARDMKRAAVGDDTPRRPTPIERPAEVSPIPAKSRYSRKDAKTSYSDIPEGKLRTLMARRFGKAQCGEDCCVPEGLVCGNGAVLPWAGTICVLGCSPCERVWRFPEHLCRQVQQGAVLQGILWGHLQTSGSPTGAVHGDENPLHSAGAGGLGNVPPVPQHYGLLARVTPRCRDPLHECGEEPRCGMCRVGLLQD